MIAPTAEAFPQFDRVALGQIVLVLQGGGALGAYQAGVYQALHESGLEPDWLIGTSIGAVNASLIAGNPPAKRLQRLREFWQRVAYSPLTEILSMMPFGGAKAASALTMAAGVKGFFEPNFLAYAGSNFPLGPELAGYYSLRPLETTLGELTEEKLFNAGMPRLTVGAANVKTAQMHYFDSQDVALTLQHIKASAAAPPLFPAVRIDNDFYWDGGLVSTTPVEAIFDDKPRRSGLIFAVHLWSPQGEPPDTFAAVFARQKEMLYASRATTHIARQKQLHKLRHVINELTLQLPEAARESNEVRHLSAYGCQTRMHVVRLVAPHIAGEDRSKDVDFSVEGIKERWNMGYADTMRVLAQKPWTHEFDPLEGFILHETEEGRVTSES